MPSSGSLTFVLVHGGFHGGWCWRDVADLLRARGHRVFTPTMTGLGERLHLTAPGVDVHTHVQDLVAVIEAEELEDVVLVAHSYGGTPCTGVADRIPERLARVIFLDAQIGADGVSPFEGTTQAILDELAAGPSVNDTPVLEPLPVEVYGVVEPGQQAWVGRRITTQPLATCATPLTLAHPPGNGLPCTFIHCTEPVLDAMVQHHERAVALGWPVHELATGHDAMVSAPAELTDLLERIARGG